MECPSCRAEIREGSKFCNQCGAALPPRCPSCGHLNAPNSKFCSECGVKLSTTRARLHKRPDPAERRFESASARRAPAAHGDVLRSGRLDGTRGAAMTLRTARDDRSLPSLRRRSGHPLRRVRRSNMGDGDSSTSVTHRRMRTMPSGPSGPALPWSRHAGLKQPNGRAAGPDWHCDRARGDRRSDRTGKNPKRRCRVKRRTWPPGCRRLRIRTGS